MHSRKRMLLIQLTTLVLAGVILPGSAAAAFTISSVTNAASRIPAGFPSYGIAQGAVFAVIGTGVGQDPPVQATFPLPTSDGLAGVSVQVAVGSTTVDAIMVFVSANEVDAILPSNTPLRHRNSHGKQQRCGRHRDITVVRSAFGIFTLVPGGFGSALAFTTSGDGTPSLVSPLQPVRQARRLRWRAPALVRLPATKPRAAPPIFLPLLSLYGFGSTQVPVVSAGRGACCSGIDPTYPIPQGVAGWDLISFVVPDGVSGCTVTVAVQIGNMISNIPSIAIAGGNGLCFDFSGITFDPTAVSGSIKTSLVSFTRVTVKGYETTGASTVISDVGAAAFQSVDVGPSLLTVSNLPAFLASATGFCTVVVYRFDSSNPPPTNLPGTPGTPPVMLDAGDPITEREGASRIQADAEAKRRGLWSVVRQRRQHSAAGGLQPIVSGGPPFLDPGAYALDNGGGGTDIVRSL